MASLPQTGRLYDLRTTEYAPEQMYSARHEPLRASLTIRSTRNFSCRFSFLNRRGLKGCTSWLKGFAMDTAFRSGPIRKTPNSIFGRCTGRGSYSGKSRHPLINLSSRRSLRLRPRPISSIEKGHSVALKPIFLILAAVASGPITLTQSA